MASSSSTTEPRGGTSNDAISPDTLAEFQSNPWTASFVNSPDYTAVETSSRTTTSETGGDAFFADTLGTSSTIPHLLSLRLNNPSTPPREPPTLPPPPAKLPAPKNPPELITLASLGNPGLNGHANVAHGGAVTTILDEVLWLAVGVQNDPAGQGEPYTSQLYTNHLDVRFLRPVRVPAKCVVKAWCIARDDRKFWMRGQLLQEEEEGFFDGIGGGSIEAVKRKRVCADAVGFLVQARPQKL